MVTSGIKRRLKQILPQGARQTMRSVGESFLDGGYRMLCLPLGWLPETADGGLLCYLLRGKELTPESIILGYHQGVFPAPEHSNAIMRWHDPDVRGILPLDHFHIPRRLARTIRQGRYEIRFDTDFRAVMEGCAETKPGRETTWLSGEYIEVLVKLHQMGFAHSFEAWQDDRLAGGGCGVAFGACFSGMSLFHRESDAAKVAFVHLVEKLKSDGFSLLDLWWPTEFFNSFGAIEISRNEFKKRLAHALVEPAIFLKEPQVPVGIP